MAGLRKGHVDGHVRHDFVPGAHGPPAPTRPPLVLRGLCVIPRGRDTWGGGTQAGTERDAAELTARTVPAQAATSTGRLPTCQGLSIALETQDGTDTFPARLT